MTKNYRMQNGFILKENKYWTKLITEIRTYIALKYPKIVEITEGKYKKFEISNCSSCWEFKLSVNLSGDENCNYSQ